MAEASSAPEIAVLPAGTGKVAQGILLRNTQDCQGRCSQRSLISDPSRCCQVLLGLVAKSRFYPWQALLHSIHCHLRLLHCLKSMRPEACWNLV
mmetsp:Transcript_127178/g.368202  ORF Transcript_127178/g.368202 Transcript_127178/m.368202 type:complete len:94 (+) Transcript_127178:1142-1423(+)